MPDVSERVLIATVYAAAVEGSPPAELVVFSHGRPHVLEAAVGMARRLGGLVGSPAQVIDRLQHASRLVR